MPQTFATFSEFVEQFVKPLGAAHPTWKRLDGQSSGGNRTPAAYVRVFGRRWRINSDTWLQPCLIASKALAAGPPENVFVMEHTPKGTATLELHPTHKGGSHYKRFYLYEVKD